MRRAVVIGVGNSYRRDDGIGPAVAAAVAAPPGVAVVCCPAEPTAILDAWADSRLAIVVDAAVVDAAVGDWPGLIRTSTPDECIAETPVSSHDLSLAQTYELGRALGRAPDELIVVTVAIADTGHGMGLSPEVAAALPEAVRTVERLVAVQARVQQSHKSGDQQP